MLKGMSITRNARLNFKYMEVAEIGFSNGLENRGGSEMGQ